MESGNSILELRNREGSSMESSVRNKVVRRIVLAAIILAPLSLNAKLAKSNQVCGAGIPMQDFYVNRNGDITDTGRSSEGPVCVQIHYNRLRFNLALNFQTTYGKGVDLTSALTGQAAGAQPGGGDVSLSADEIKLKKILGWLRSLDADANTMRNGVTTISNLLDFIDANIGAGKEFPAQPLASSYKSLKPVLMRAQARPEDALPTDLSPGSSCPSSGSVGTPAPDSIIGILQAFKANGGFYSTHQEDVDAALTIAAKYRCGVQTETDLAKNTAILRFWDSRFQQIGMRTDITDIELSHVATAQIFIESAQLNCNNIFNQSSTTTASITGYDESQSLSGNFAIPNPHQNQNFFSLTCASPFSLTAGIEFSTIPSREFAIVKSAGGANNTSINKFGLTSDSSIHPLPIALAHVRLKEFMDHRFALHGSAGASGNIQGQNSGGSSAEFLVGPSLSFFRTMYFTTGVHIGTESKLAGGFKVRDTVPSDISSVQVTKSYTAGFGFAITFTKP